MPPSPVGTDEFDIGGTTLNWKFVAAAFAIALGACVAGTLLFVFTAIATTST